MRIAIISPYSSGPIRGNIITVRRVAHFLEQSGATTLTLAVDNFSINEMKQHLAEFKPDIIHGFHARYCGTTTRKLAEHMQIPYVITITGSDLNDSTLRNHPDTVGAIESAQAMVCFHSSDADRLAGFFPKFCGKVTIVAQGVEPLPIVKGDKFDIYPGSFVLLLPAALRPVKRIEFPILSLSQLAHSDQKLRLVIAGGIIDNDYAALIRNMLNDHPFATWLGEVPHERMGSLYARADVVLNCSLSESMPNSLMEAMAIGRPVLAANIPGNHSLIENNNNGWLYDGVNDFRSLVLQIRGNEHFRAETGRRAKEYIKTNFSPHVEATQYLSLYKSLMRTNLNEP